MNSIIDRFRHWLIRKLSCGDMIILNAHIRADGKIVPRNLGPSTIAWAKIDVIEDEDGMPLARFVSGDAPMSFYNVYFSEPCCCEAP